MPQLGMGELIVIFLVVLLLFGANQIPKVARGLGQGLREFKRAARELQEEEKDQGDKEKDKDKDKDKPKPIE
jgi:sec-independent protein translocase protein TatA